MAATLIVKITHGTEIRRFTAQETLTWPSLAKKVSSIFELPSGALKLTYIDDEGDRITLSSDDELKEAIGLAFTSSPAVLRLSVMSAPEPKLPPDVKMADAATAAEPPRSTADAGTTAKPATANAGTASGPQDASVATFISTLASQLPALVGELPPHLRNLIPHAELDLAATIAANAAANAPAAASAAAAPGNDPSGVHPGVTCDRSGQCPIIGNRYHLVGHNYDLCEAEFAKLTDKEKPLYQRIPPPFVHNVPHAGSKAEAKNAAGGVHPGVECDRSGQCPIVGNRYHLVGHNYDLCEAEFAKLPAAEKLLYETIPPPASAGGGCGPWRPSGPWAAGRWGGGCRWGGGAAAASGGPGGGPKLAARFVRDVSIFDGTQMHAGTTFTKIWRLKNTGEVAWPPGTRILFVGGDQMTTEMSVPLSRATAVQPGEEVDVAVEMVAPPELGRYLGYWRLVGPHGRRKFGQRVWCHVQVVDPADGGAASLTDADLAHAVAEIEKKKSDLAANEPDADPADEPSDAPVGGGGSSCVAWPSSAAAAGESMADEPEAAEPACADAPHAEVDATLTDAADRASDDGFLVTEAMATMSVESEYSDLSDSTAAPKAAAKSGAAEPDVSTVSGVKAALAVMGFANGAMADVVLAKHGADLESCARDLAMATEWEPMLDDLAEMGFANRELNLQLMLKHDGNVKRTVRELVEDA